MNHPQQPVVTVDGIHRYKANEIVRFLLVHGPYNLNDIAALRQFTNDDRRQFAKLIGYSLCGYADLWYAEKDCPLSPPASAPAPKKRKKSKK